ncbi:MAG: ferredoxin reductase family protein [Pseudomonadota bacterium]
MHAVVLIAVYLAVALTPLVLSALQGRALRPFWDELSSGLAMTAFAILLVEFVLSGRFKVISARIGMDVTMRVHQLLARTAVVFVLVHPFLYHTPFLTFPLPWDESRQLSLGLSIGSLASGLIAWIALPALVLVSIFRDQLPYRYETWRLMHGVGAVLIAVMTMHHTLNAGRYSSDPVLAGFWILLLAAALGSLGYSYVVMPLKEAVRPYQLTSVRKIARRTWELTIKPQGGDGLRFAAGQFVWLNLGHSPFSLHENPFSISSAPGHEAGIQFVIKQVGDFTDQIGDVLPGTAAYLDGPHGNLTLEGRSGKGIALIAGGVGVAPLLSIARQLDKDSDPRPLLLLYGNRLADQIVYRDELKLLAGKTNRDVRLVLSEPEPGWDGLTGMIDQAMLDEVLCFEDASQWLYLVCGPPAMLDVVEQALIARGVPAGQIVSERFYYD